MSDQPELNVKKNFASRSAPCPICGGSSFTWGKLVGYGGAKVAFVNSKDGFWKQLYGRDTTERACRGCGAVQVFLKYPSSIGR